MLLVMLLLATLQIFFDSGVAPAAPAGEAVKPMAEKLPEGFFDDPKMDAKVR